MTYFRTVIRYHKVTTDPILLVKECAFEGRPILLNLRKLAKNWPTFFFVKRPSLEFLYDILNYNWSNLISQKCDFEGRCSLNILELLPKPLSGTGAAAINRLRPEKLYFSFYTSVPSEAFFKGCPKNQNIFRLIILGSNMS